ncbi:hypothetical protein [Devosia sp.]|uniref:hypothetical protein n=1 Tax=Devosia sp. TaxID=1871048 RepID=UPI003265C88A
MFRNFFVNETNDLEATFGMFGRFIHEPMHWCSSSHMENKMTFKTLVSGFVLAVAMASAAPAFAATTIAGNTVSGSDLSSVQARCNQLNTAASVPVSLGDQNSHDSDSFNELNVASNANSKVEEMDKATTRINLHSISLGDCVSAGLVKAS